jgi:hypothetical protein
MYRNLTISLKFGQMLAIEIFRKQLVLAISSKQFEFLISLFGYT